MLIFLIRVYPGIRFEVFREGKEEGCCREKRVRDRVDSYTQTAQDVKETALIEINAAE